MKSNKSSAFKKIKSDCPFLDVWRQSCCHANNAFVGLKYVKCKSEGCPLIVHKQKTKKK